MQDHASEPQGSPPRSSPRRLGVSESIGAETLAAARAALEGGGAVGLPSETLYWVAEREPESPPAAEPVTRWLASRAALLEAAAGAEGVPRAVLARLVERYWPGPLVLELRLGAARGSVDGWTRFALPAHPLAQALAEALPFPLWTREAFGPSGEPLVDADALVAERGAELALVLDGGPTRLGEPAGILRIGPGTFRLRREGLLPIEDLRRTGGLSIAFVCTGNTCRSPMAEGLARDLLARRLGTRDLAAFGFRLSSSGVAAGRTQPAAGHAIALLAERGIDLSGHRSQPSLPEEIARTDRVYTLTRAHLEALAAQLPPGRAGHLELLDPEGRDVPDPVGGSREDYAHCAATLERALRARLEDWA